AGEQSAVEHITVEIAVAAVLIKRLKLILARVLSSSRCREGNRGQDRGQERDRESLEACQIHRTHDRSSSSTGGSERPETISHCSPVHDRDTRITGCSVALTSMVSTWPTASDTDGIAASTVQKS